ncbi:hypothetical protein A0H81_02058 [Grifola frondosa]|uniref:Uncharacterized protein n=1 Tax=Grifola frondosa TaxID=5627 RepID=A0A1C7MM12_GRIFR|nr:hypothetical protein A0H81_02058 [Grifola frondosa]
MRKETDNPLFNLRQFDVSFQRTPSHEHGGLRIDGSSPQPPLSSSVAPREGEPDPADLDKLRKWQEERIARKLRGEYESAVFHLAEVVNNNLSTPLRIASIRVEGAAKTRKSFLGSIITPFLRPRLRHS